MDKDVKKIESLYEEIERICSVDFYQKDVRMIGSERARQRRDKIFCLLYSLGESCIDISVRTKWSVQIVNHALQIEREKREKYALDERFCNLCGVKYVPQKISQTFCSRKCFRASYYRTHLADTRRLLDLYSLYGPSEKTEKHAECPTCGSEFTTQNPAQKYCTIYCRDKINWQKRNAKARNGRLTAPKQ